MTMYIENKLTTKYNVLSPMSLKYMYTKCTANSKYTAFNKKIELHLNPTEWQLKTESNINNEDV